MNTPQPGDNADAMLRGMESSGERVAVLLVFWREGTAVAPSIPIVPSRWHVAMFPPHAAKRARKFAKLHGTQVVASFVDVPRFCIEGWQ